MADGLSAAGLRWLGRCAAQRATAPRPIPDGGGAGASQPAPAQLGLCPGVLDGGPAGVAFGGALSADPQRQPRAASLAPGRVLLEAAQVGPGPAARPAHERK